MRLALCRREALGPGGLMGSGAAASYSKDLSAAAGPAPIMTVGSRGGRVLRATAPRTGGGTRTCGTCPAAVFRDGEFPRRRWRARRRGRDPLQAVFTADLSAFGAQSPQLAQRYRPS